MNITTFVSEIAEQTLNIYDKNGHYYSNLAQSQIPFYMHQWPIVSDHSTDVKKIHLAIMEEYMWMD